MTAFEKAAIGFVGGAALAMVLTAAVNPLDQETRSPRASFVAVAIGEVPEDLHASDDSERRHRTPVITVKTLTQTFTKLNYDIDEVRAGTGEVPHLFVAALPSDMRRIRKPEIRKQVFFKTVLPLVLQVNREIFNRRSRLVDLQVRRGKGEILPPEDRLWLAAMADRYGVKREDHRELLRRMDIVPPSLALAQAAEESGWGTSRFAQEGNALFGQWTFSSGSGLIPRNRDEGQRHGVKAFDNLIEAVRAYALNLNTHRAYRAFRAERQAMRRSKGQLDGYRLARTMTNYSQRGSEYVESIQTIIGANRLRTLDNAKLGALRPTPGRKPVI